MFPTRLNKSAEFLRNLNKQFGNLGLAAAAYNAGPKRVQDWLAGSGGLPTETAAYVQIITGHAANDWRLAPSDQWNLMFRKTYRVRNSSSFSPTRRSGCRRSASQLQQRPRLKLSGDFS